MKLKLKEKYILDSYNHRLLNNCTAFAKIAGQVTLSNLTT